MNTKRNDLDEMFQRALADFRKRYKNNKSAAISALEGKIGRLTVYQLLSDYENYSNKSYQNRIKNELIDFIYPKVDNKIYNLIHGLMKVDSSEDGIMEKYCGNYKYWRYFPKNNNIVSELEFVNGKIKIYEENGCYYFCHSSHNFDSNGDKWEHVGPALHANSHVFMLGFRSNVMRLAVMNAVGSLEEEIAYGVVSSVRRQVYNAFAAISIIIHEKNPLYKTNITEEFFRKQIDGLVHSDYGFLFGHPL